VDPRAPIVVVVPAHQAAEHLAAALDSLRAQTRTDWTAIVVDDGSSDATAAIAGRFAAEDQRIRLLRQPRGGVSAARNTGLRHLPDEAGFVAFLDADDELLPDALEVLADALLVAPHADAVHALAETVDQQGLPLDPGAWPAFQRRRWALRPGRPGWRWVPLAAGLPTGYDSVLHDWRGFPTAVLMVRREAVDAVGEFDPAFTVSEDRDYVRRLARRRPLIALDRVVARYRRHPGNSTQDADLVKRSARQFYRKALHDPDDDPATRALARRAWRALQVEAAAEAVQRVPVAVRDRAPQRVLREVAAVGVHAVRFVRGAPGAAGERSRTP
jgi:glycosyltransferase involved in cell wall biosynthesis